MMYLNRVLTVASFLMLPGAIPEIAAAQENEPQTEETKVEDTIVVRGQKREETLLGSDLSVTVLDVEAIRDTRLRDVRRIDDLVPNVQFNESGQLSSVFVSIRGIESNPFIVNRAAIYIDGIPFRELSNAVLNQVESIEVLRGPQSTLYGANSEAGLILITTRQPTESVEGELRLTGSTYNGDMGLGLDGFIGGPLIQDKLLGSLAFKVSEEDAYVSNPASSIGQPGRVDDMFLQGRLQWFANDRLSVKATAYILETDAPGLFEQEYAPLDRTLYDATYRDTVSGGRSVGRFEFLNDTPKLTTSTDIVAGLSATYQLDYGKLDAAVSYSNADEDSAGLDLDLTALPTVAGRDVEEETIWSGELRFTSPDSDVFEYIIGASWYSQEDQVQLGTAFGPATLDSYALSPPQSNDGEDFAVFASATAGLWVDGLSGTVGIRWDRADRSTNQQEGLLDLGFTQLPFQNISLSDSFEEILPRFVVSYEASDRVNLYASASKGYVPGGFNLAAAEAALSDDIVSYDQETVWSYEAGVKTLFSDGKGYLNVAAFYIESDNWQEVQVLFNDQGQVASSAFIAAEASIQSSGFEIETSYEPIEALKLTAGFGYTDAQYKDFQITATENLDGLPVKLVPEFDANFAARYEFANGFFLRGELSATGETPLDERGNAVRDAVTVVNLQTGYEGDKYSLRLFAENLTDERIESGLAFANFSAPDGNIYAPYDAPRIVGIEAEYRF